MFTFLQPYINTIKSILSVSVLAAICFGWWYYGHIRYEEGKADIQALRDKDKAEGDRQAAETAKLNKDRENALKQTKIALADTRGNLNIALERLRDLPTVLWQGDVFMAAGQRTAVPGAPGNPGGIGIRVEKRIGSCEGAGSDPCYITREFFEQALNDAVDRGILRKAAQAQGIRLIPKDGK